MLPSGREGDEDLQYCSVAMMHKWLQPQTHRTCLGKGTFEERRDACMATGSSDALAQTSHVRCTCPGYQVPQQAHRLFKACPTAPKRRPECCNKSCYDSLAHAASHLRCFAGRTAKCRRVWWALHCHRPLHKCLARAFAIITGLYL